MVFFSPTENSSIRHRSRHRCSNKHIGFLIWPLSRWCQPQSHFRHSSSRWAFSLPSTCPRPSARLSTWDGVCRSRDRLPGPSTRLLLECCCSHIFCSEEAFGWLYSRPPTFSRTCTNLQCHKDPSPAYVQSFLRWRCQSSGPADLRPSSGPESDEASVISSALPSSIHFPPDWTPLNGFAQRVTCFTVLVKSIRPSYRPQSLSLGDTVGRPFLNSF